MREQIMQCEEIKIKIERLQNKVNILEEMHEKSKMDYWTYKDYKLELELWQKTYETKCKGMFQLFCERVE